ncbi:MAG: TRAP transporter small permease [Desulfatiglandales bacterium]|nr:TRAP transporter small permease [Desulfatiglandales bacterium]
MKFFKKAGLVFDKCNEIFAGIAAVILAIGWITVCAEIFMRYFLNRPTRWSMELIENVIVFVTFLCATWLLKNEWHVRIDLLETRLKKGSQFFLNSVTSILCATACLLVALYGLKTVWSQYERGLRFATILEPPMWPLYAIIPFAFILLFIQFIRRTHGNLKSWKSSLGVVNEGYPRKP